MAELIPLSIKNVLIYSQLKFSKRDRQLLSPGVLGFDLEPSDFRRVSDKNAALSLPLGRVHISDKRKDL